MKTFLLFLIIFAFLQSAFLPVNLILVALIARSLVIEDKDNLFLAFFSGLLLSFLSQVNLGYYPLVFLLVIKLGSLFKKIPVSLNILTVFLYGGLLVVTVAFLNKLFLGQNLNLINLIIESILVLPVFIITKFWEERFTVKKSIKLKV